MTKESQFSSHYRWETSLLHSMQTCSEVQPDYSTLSLRWVDGWMDRQTDRWRNVSYNKFISNKCSSLNIFLHVRLCSRPPYLSKCYSDKRVENTVRHCLTAKQESSTSNGSQNSYETSALNSSKIQPQSREAHVLTYSTFKQFDFVVHW